MKIIKGRQRKPANAIIIGEPGVGKSTFAAQAPEPIFLGAEENDELMVDRAPIPKTFKEFTEQLDELKRLKYKTAVIDTIDSIEQMRIRELLGNKSQLNWDKQAELANDMVGVRGQLKDLRDNHDMNIFVLAHCKTRVKTDTIHQADYDTTETAIRKGTMSIFEGWTSNVLFAAYKTEITMNTQTEKNYVIGEGDRVLFTEKRPGHPGKNRLGLPYEMPLDFKEFWKHYEAFYAKGDTRTAEQIIASIDGLKTEIEKAETVKVIEEEVKKHSKNKAQLLKIEQRVKERANK